MKRIKSKHLIAGIVCAFVIGAMVLGLIAQTRSNLDGERLIFKYKRANPLYLDGEKQLLQKKMAKAEKKFLECLSIMPEHADAYYALAKIYLLQGELPKALDSIAIAKKNYVFLAKFKTFIQEQYRDRLRSRRQALEDRMNTLREEMISAPGNSASQSALNQYVRDIEIIDRSLRSSIPETYEIPADYLFINGNILFKMGMLSDAAAQYREAIRIEPLHSNSYNNLASVCFALKKYREALEWITLAEAAGVKVNPEFKKVVENKVSALQ